MKKVHLFFIICICVLCFVGCTSQSKEPEITARRPMVMINGDIYLDTGKEISETINDSDILGEISSEVAVSEVPTKNDEGNFSCIGAKYAFHGDGIVLKLEDGRFFFELEKD